MSTSIKVLNDTLLNISFPLLPNPSKINQHIFVKSDDNSIVALVLFS